MFAAFAKGTTVPAKGAGRADSTATVDGIAGLKLPEINSDVKQGKIGKEVNCFRLSFLLRY